LYQVARLEQRARPHECLAAPAAPSHGILAAPLALDGIPEQAGNVGPAEALDLADAGRRGDVDFRHVVADHVDADEDEAAFLQRRADAGANLALALRQVAFFGAPTDMHVRARFALGRNSVDGA